MEKQILVGSIIVVLILVLVSFTGVVGYQTTKSSTIARASPLFKIRTNRVIGEESKDFTCEYFGKGELNILSFPTRNYKIELIQKAIEKIREIDDKTFNSFINLVIHRFQQSKECKDVTVGEVMRAIYLLKDNQENRVTKYYSNNVNNTWREDFTPTICWYPFCYLFLIWEYLTMIPLAIILYIYIFFSNLLTFAWTCGEDCIYPTVGEDCVIPS